MQEEQFIKGMEILRPYISPTKIARELGVSAMTIHNYMNGLGGSETIRSQIFNIALRLFTQNKEKINKVSKLLESIGIQEEYTHEQTA